MIEKTDAMEEKLIEICQQVQCEWSMGGLSDGLYGDYAKEVARRALAARDAHADERGAFQSRVHPWMLECFGSEIAADKIERNHRFFEEATEAVQANGMTRSEAHQLVDYTFDRPVGELHQEIGGVMVTLAALCLASGQDMHAAGETELARIWTKVEQIRAKQAAKPKHSPLPEARAGVAVHVKQLGAQPRGWCAARTHIDEAQQADLDDDYCDFYEAHERNASCPGRCTTLRDKKGGDMAEWPEDLRVREFPEVAR